MSNRARPTKGPVLMMVPPLGFLEQAVARGLAQVAAEESLVAVQSAVEPDNDIVARPKPNRRRRDSAIIDMRGGPDSQRGCCGR